MPTANKLILLLALWVCIASAGNIVAQEVPGGPQPQAPAGGTVPEILDNLIGPDGDAKQLKPALPQIKLLPQYRDAVDWAVADLELMRNQAAQRGLELDTSVYRYVWIPDASPTDQALTSFTLNSVVSRSDINYPPGKDRSPIQYVAGGRLVRVDLLRLCPLNNGADFKTVAAVWDKMFNPYLILEEAQKELEQDVKEVVTTTERVRVQVPRYRAQDGRWYDYKFVDREVQKEQVVRKKVEVDGKVYGPHVDLQSAATLQALTSCDNPIVWCYTLYSNALTQADGGLYYEFMGIRKANEEERKKGLSDLDVFLLSLGVSEELIDKLRADQRAAMIKSNVTGKPRRIDFFDRPSRTGKNQGLITITQDMLDGDYDPKSDPFLNLLEFKVGGKELIFERNNGHLGYVLYDGNGNLVDEAPPNLVSDHLIPAPHTKRLQPAISCIRCHGRPEEHGWKSFTNEVRTSLAGFLNVYDDVEGEQQKLNVPETLEKVARLYAGVLDKPLRRAREDQSDTIVECVGNIARRDGGPWQFEDVAKGLNSRFTYYYYTPVSPIIACRELGYQVETDEAAVTLLNRLLGRLPPAIGVPVQREDVRLGLLKQGTAINRFQWELVYIDAARRAAANTPLLHLKSPDEPKQQE